MLIKDSFSVLMARMDTLILVYFSPLAEVARYNVVGPTADVLLHLSRPFAKILFPLSSKLWAQEKIEELQLILRQIHRYILILYIPAGAIFILLSKQLLELLFGQVYANGYIGLNILILGFIFTSINVINLSVLMGIGRQKQATIDFTIAHTINFILNIILVIIFSKLNQGYLGVIIATGMSSFILFMLFLNDLKKHLNYSLEYEVFIKIIIIGTIGFALAFFLTNNVQLILIQSILRVVFFSIFYIAGVFGTQLLSVEEIKTVIKTMIGKNTNFIEK